MSGFHIAVLMEDCALRGLVKGNYVDILKVCYYRCKKTIFRLRYGKD